MVEGRGGKEGEEEEVERTALPTSDFDVDVDDFNALRESIAVCIFLAFRQRRERIYSALRSRAKGGGEERREKQSEAKREVAFFSGKSLERRCGSS